MRFQPLRDGDSKGRLHHIDATIICQLMSRSQSETPSLTTLPARGLVDLQGLGH